MQKIIEGSVLFRWLTAFFGWIGTKWHESRIVTWFLAPGRHQERYQNSLFARLGRSLHGFLCLIFEKLRLNRLFKGSIFKQAFIWCLIRPCWPLSRQHDGHTLFVIVDCSGCSALGCDCEPEALCFSR
jgi:hypothetical protein